MNIDELKKILFEYKNCNKEMFDDLLYTLCDSQDELIMKTIYGYQDYEIKICKIINYIVEYFTENLKLYRCRDISSNEYIKEQVGVLPNEKLIKFIESIDTDEFILVDYEAPDAVISCNKMICICNELKNLNIINELMQEDIDNIVQYIRDTDMFDITLFE